MKSILIEELEGKKSFEAHWDTFCDDCGDEVFEGDTFYFFGDKKKVCQSCYSQLLDDLENGDAIQ